MFSKVTENLAVAVRVEMPVILVASRTRKEKAIAEIKTAMAVAVDKINKLKL